MLYEDNWFRLVSARNVSHNMVLSYRDAIVLLLTFMSNIME